MIKALQYSVIFIGIISSFSFTTPATDWTRHVAIELKSTHPIYNNGVGNEWNNYLVVNDQIVSEGERSIFKINRRAPFIIEAHAIENDKDYPDEGVKSMTFTYSDLIAIDQSRFEITVQVTENGGRESGKMAEWMFILEISKESKP